MRESRVHVSPLPSHTDMGNSLDGFSEEQSSNCYEIEDDTPWESSVKSDPCFASERQRALQKKLGLASPEVAALIQESDFVSLGSHCRVSMALENMGLRKSA